MQILDCHGHVKKIENAAYGKIYNIENFKWVLYIKQTPMGTEFVCEHKNDYELTDSDKDKILKKIEVYTELQEFLVELQENNEISIFTQDGSIKFGIDRKVIQTEVLAKYFKEGI